jgi:HEAT repeat protein
MKFIYLGTIAAVLLAGMSTPAAGQTAAGEREMSVEESYRQESVELMIIREQSRSESLEMKLIALEYIRAAMERGNTGAEIQGALEYLSMEGILNKTVESGRIINNHPEVRRIAAACLGDMGTVEAKNLLLKLLRIEREPMVLQEAIKSLGKIGNNDNNEAIGLISEVVDRRDKLGQPDNLLAFSALDAYEKIARANGGLPDPLVIQTILRVAEGPYTPTVRNRAKEVLANLREYAAGERQ